GAWAAGAACPPSTDADGAAGGMPAGRAARPPPDDPRCGFLSWLRLFFRAIGIPEPSGVYPERGKALDTSNGLWYKLTRVQHIACARSREPTRARSLQPSCHRRCNAPPHLVLVVFLARIAGGRSVQATVWYFEVARASAARRSSGRRGLLTNLVPNSSAKASASEETTPALQSH